MKCPNCGTHLGCGCQTRKLPNGKQGCIKCVPPVTINKPNDSKDKK